jgi:hypothetical protein
LVRACWRALNIGSSVDDVIGEETAGDGVRGGGGVRKRGSFPFLSKKAAPPPTLGPSRAPPHQPAPSRAGNQRAIVADRKYLALEGPVNFYSMYRFHDYHFKIYGAMFLGQVGPALEAADEVR